MPTVTIRANQAGDEGPETLTERVVATQLRDEHYATQLIERLTRATTEAEGLEVATEHANIDESAATHPDGARISAKERSRSHTPARISYLGPRA